MGYHEPATICKSGHVVSSRKANYLKYCKMCGEGTISQCHNCSAAIHGYYNIPGVFSTIKYKKPYYCHECGEPYPWTSQIIESAIELLYLDEELTKEHKEIIKNALPDLIIERPTTPVAIAKYKKHLEKGSGFIKEGMKNLLVDVVSETVKKSIWG